MSKCLLIKIRFVFSEQAQYTYTLDYAGVLDAVSVEMKESCELRWNVKFSI